MCGGGVYITILDRLPFPWSLTFREVWYLSLYKLSHIPDTSLDPEEGGSKFLQLFTISMWCYKTVQVKERYNLKFSVETKFFANSNYVWITNDIQYLLTKLNIVSSNNTVGLGYTAVFIIFPNAITYFMSYKFLLKFNEHPFYLLDNRFSETLLSCWKA
jgi:hypothetical protein